MFQIISGMWEKPILLTFDKSEFIYPVVVFYDRIIEWLRINVLLNDCTNKNESNRLTGKNVTSLAQL